MRQPYLRQSVFPSEEKIFRLHGARHYGCNRTLDPGIFFSSRTLPETMMAIEASEAKVSVQLRILLAV